MTAQLKKYTLILLSIWLSAGMISLAWNLYDNRQERKALALQTAQAFLVQIQNTRAWIAGHQGVYVPVTENHPPNPLLVSDPGRDLTTKNNLQLTKVNPVAMIRELSQIASDNKGVTFHISSLDPIHPENSPYPWEKPWLQEFSTNPQATSSTVTIDNNRYFRFMAPILVHKECLGCHAEKKYSLGAVRGGISITLPMEPTRLNWSLILSHIGPMTAGSLMIIFFSTRLAAREDELLATNQKLYHEIHQHKETQKELQSSRDQLEERVSQRTLELSEANQQLNRKIHERAHIEEALTIIYDEFYQLFNSAPDGMLVVDRNFDILRANHAFAELCGLPLNKIIGQKCYELFCGPTCKTSACPIESIFKGEKRVEIECEKVVFANTRNIPCIVTSTPFRESDGRLIGAIMVVTDISNRKQAELALEHSTERLKESNQALKDFAHIVSHDLQEPLMLIQAFSSRLQTCASDALSAQCQRYVEQINRASTRMRELINGLLLYARISNTTAPFESVNLSTVVNEVLDTLTLQLEKSNSSLTVDTLPSIMGDPLQIRQLIQNIISNSIKYRNKETRHTIHIQNQGTFQNQDNSTFVQISINDNGMGFKPEDSRQIFDIFERAHSEKDIDGTGIGLAICKKITQRHGGNITATGQPEKGAQFTIQLPAAKQRQLHPATSI